MENNEEQLNPTTVRLTEKAQEIKEDLAPVYGLKNILSAGLILFGILPSDEQKSKIKEANAIVEQKGITLLDMTFFAQGLLPKEQFQQMWDATPKKVRDNFIKIIQPARTTKDRVVAKTLLDAVQVREAKMREKKGGKTSKS